MAVLIDLIEPESLAVLRMMQADPAASIAVR
jgi:hypothetical protein